MLARLALCLCSLCALSSTAQAGAWPREPGDGFVSLGSMIRPDDSETALAFDPMLFVEYGLRPRLTVGLTAFTADGGSTQSALAFATVPIGPADARHKFSLTAGLGAYRAAEDPTAPLASLGFAWGTGFDTGWLTIETQVIYHPTDQSWHPKLDATWGRNWTDRWTSTLQLTAGTGFDGSEYAQVSPTVVFRLSDRLRTGLGLSQSLTGDRDIAIKLETWISF